VKEDGRFYLSCDEAL